MSFWDLNEGGTAASNGGSYEAPSVSMEPIPDKTGCVAAIEEAKWDDYEGDRFISLKWRVAQPQEYANRVVFQKVKVYGTSRDKDPRATADKAKRMLAAIDANAGGKLMKVQGEPSDQDLMTALMAWAMKNEKGEEMTGNWISAVSPAKGGQAAAPAQAASAPAGDFDDDIPF